jgi:hypothetical protein
VVHRSGKVRTRLGSTALSPTARVGAVPGAVALVEHRRSRPAALSWDGWRTPGIDPGQTPTPWRQLVVPLGVCGAGIFVGVLLKGAGNTSILGSTLGFIGYIAFIAILGLVAYAITGHN